MMLMKAPSVGGSSSGTGGRDVIFRLTVQPDASAQSKLRTWGETMRREQALFSSEGKRVAREWGDAWAQEFDKLAIRSRAAAQRMAADWGSAMRGGVGIPGNVGGGSSGFQMNMAGLGASRPPTYTPNPWPTMGGSGPWAPPASMAGLGYGTPSWQTSHMYPSFAGGSSPAPMVGGGRVRSGGGASAGSGNRSFEAINNLVLGGSHLARGIAYSGLAGEEDSQKILDTLLRMEGLLSLIHGGISIGKGLNAIGALGPLSAAVGGGMGLAAVGAGLAGIGVLGGAAYEARNEGKGRLLPKGERPGFFARLQQNPFSDLTSGNWFSGNGDDTSTAIFNADQSLKRMQKQEASAATMLSEREKMMQGDEADFQKNAAKRSFQAQYRRMGQRGDPAEYASLGVDLIDAQKELDGLKQKEREAEKKGTVALEAATDRRMRQEMEINGLKQQQMDIELRGAERRNQTELVRAQSVLGIAQGRLARQEGMTTANVGGYRSDLEHYGSLSFADRSRTAAAFRAVQGGYATGEQAQMASQYDAYAPQAKALLAQRGQRYGGRFFDGAGATESLTALDAAKGAVKKAAEEVEVLQKRQINIVVKKEGNNDDLKDAAQQIIEAFTEERDRERKALQEKIDQLQRQFNKQQVARENVAR